MPVALHLAPKPDKEPLSKKVKDKDKEKDAFLPEAEKPVQLPGGVGRNRRILVVDDNVVVLKAFELKLKASGFIPITSSNAATVASTAEVEKADLIILDINFGGAAGMEWSGFTVLQWLRRFPELAKIPVIFMTGGDPAKFKEKALAAGAAAFFQKPVNYKELLAAILQALDVPKAGGPASR
jgi:DNA-binding response OmpR family regulator